MTASRKPQAITEGRLKEALAVLRDNSGNISKSANDLGISRRMVRHLLDAADAMQVSLEDYAPTLYEPNKSKLRTFDELRKARIEEYRRKKDSGSSQHLHVIHMADDGPFGIIALGDPHYDDPGTDLEEYEKWTAPLERSNSKNVWGFLLGDLLNNWVFPKLARLHGEQTTMQDEAWVLVEGYVKRIAPKLIGSCSGNHDDWSNADLLGWIMDKYGVLHRKIGLSMTLKTPSGHAVSIGARHRWPGNSQWNSAHAIMKAAQMGRREDILLGGDKHISGEGFVKCPSSGKITNCHQVASFKKLDDYGEELGLQDKHVTPAIGLLIDPTRPQTDKQRVTTYYDPEELVEAVKSLRKRRGFK